MLQDADFDLITKYYDQLYADRLDDLEMWLELTANIAGEALEIGCGTGRILLPLLQHNRRVTGVDLSQRALDTARRKLALNGLGRAASLHQADMRSLNLPRKNFAFAFIPINTFMHCLTTADQQATLQAVAGHLQSGGTLVVDLYHPQPQALFEADGRLVMENQFTDDVSGQITQWFVVRHLQIDRQIQDVTFILDEIDGDGSLRRATFSFPMRYVHRFEMELLLNQAGFQTQNIFGDYDMSPFQAESPRMIFAAQKTGARQAI